MVWHWVCGCKNINKETNMKRIFKWIGIVLVSLIGLLLVAGVVLHFVGKSRLNNAPEVATKPVTAPTDAAAVARGEHLVNVVSSCRLCHGDNLGGEVFVDGEMGIYVFAPNLTTGAGGVAATFSDADWERAIRHGVGGDGRTLVIMPSNIYQHYSDADLGAIIAYLNAAPPVNNDLGVRRIGFPGSVLGGVVAFDDITRINDIDHAAVGGDSPPEGATAEYGAYLVNIAACRECHAANFAGIVGSDGPPPGPNLTPGGNLQAWGEADFITTLRTGTTPGGRQIDSEMMPWPTLGQMSDTELQAIWAYLQSLPALPDNS
jgi:mono/diheme cytochrome c family protein